MSAGVQTSRTLIRTSRLIRGVSAGRSDGVCDAGAGRLAARQNAATVAVRTSLMAAAAPAAGEAESPGTRDGPRAPTPKR